MITLELATCTKTSLLARVSQQRSEAPGCRDPLFHGRWQTRPILDSLSEVAVSSKLQPARVVELSATGSHCG